MPKLRTEHLLRRHLAPFAVTFALLTTLTLANFAARVLPQLSARRASGGAVLEVLLLGVPSTVALTIPMAVFLAVLWVFTRPGVNSVLEAAQRDRHGFRRVVGPVLGAAAAIAALMLVSNAQLLPRANGQLTALLTGRTSVEQNDRSMTVGELREAARTSLTRGGPGATLRAAEYETEIQKKFALAAACLVLAVAGAPIAIRFPRGGKGLMIGASLVVFTGYYIVLVGGEALADEQVISPFIAMWTPNALLLAATLLLVWRRDGPISPRATETLAPGG